ncbi:lipoyltransferase 1, mitochondrial isoform X3 [Vespa velutina]|uniref:lipoyltransferase 1, mitochondrial isoform X3 n=1 Tax=Vespa velutina TaxID=202808 RepID=UPI001FB3422D|nr:lipoyltransferase 1, mitochondrial isoform X3 [Vespa velutina]
MSLINKCGNIVIGRALLCCRLKTIDRTKFHLRWSSSSGFNEKHGQNVNNNDIIRKSVFISQSNDVFTNLALEDWLYRNFDFTNHHVLLLWRNDPCVVIGRHQNPWLECDTRITEKHGIALVRRNSGGGTVYHDNGNLNLSFFTPKQRYNRRYNLDIITRALYREWGLKAVVNEREDIVVEGRYKVSFDTGIKTNATTSTRSSIKNLTEVNSKVEIDKLIDTLGWEYLRTKPLVLEDGGYDHIQEQKGFQLINPTEDWFPGIDKLREEFCSWEWIYGRTPQFSITKDFDMPAPNGNLYRVNLTLEIQKGIIEEIRMSLPANLASSNLNQNANVFTNLRGMRYDSNIMDNIIALISCKNFAESMSQNTKKTNMVATQ